MTTHRFSGCSTHGATIRAAMAAPISTRENGQKIGCPAKVSDTVV